MRYLLFLVLLFSVSTASAITTSTIEKRISCKNFNTDLRVLIVLRVHGETNRQRFINQTNATDMSDSDKKRYNAMVNKVFDAKVPEGPNEFEALFNLLAEPCGGI